MTKPRNTSYWIAFSIVLALLIIAPLVLPEFWRRFLTEILIWGLLAMSSDILIGYTGMVSFGHSAFFGLGIYGAAAALLMFSPPNLWLALLFGLVASALIALFVAYFSTRLRDIYFAITTLIFSQIFYVIVFTWTEVTGGENGLNFRRPPLAIPGLFSVQFTSETMHWFVLAVVTASYLILRRITRSPFGMVLQSIRENEPRTRHRLSSRALQDRCGDAIGTFRWIGRGALRGAKSLCRSGLHFLPGVGRNGDLQRHGRHRHACRADRRRRILSTDARIPFTPLGGPVSLSHPAWRRFHRDDHFPAARSARLRAAMA